MKFFAKIFTKLNQSLFSFFSGICVSLSLNIFTTILMDSSKYFSILNVLSVVIMIVGSGILILESVLLQNYSEIIMNAKKIKMSIEEICSSPKIKEVVIKLMVYLFVALVLVIASLLLLYCDFNWCANL